MSADQQRAGWTDGRVVSGRPKRGLNLRVRGAGKGRTAGSMVADPGQQPLWSLCLCSQRRPPAPRTPERRTNKVPPPTNTALTVRKDHGPGVSKEVPWLSGPASFLPALLWKGRAPHSGAQDGAGPGQPSRTDHSHRLGQDEKAGDHGPGRVDETGEEQPSPGVDAALSVQESGLGSVPLVGSACACHWPPILPVRMVNVETR